VNERTAMNILLKGESASFKQAMRRASRALKAFGIAMRGLPWAPPYTYYVKRPPRPPYFWRGL
jgi:hypothetical protein